MDYSFFDQNPNPRRSQRMELLSVCFGILSITTSCLVYPSVILGSLGIVFALLSRGGEMSLTLRAKTGLTLSIVGLCIIAGMFLITIAVANLYYGGLEDMIRTVYGNMGIDYDALMQNYR